MNRGFSLRGVSFTLGARHDGARVVVGVAGWAEHPGCRQPGGHGCAGRPGLSRFKRGWRPAEICGVVIRSRRFWASDMRLAP